MRASSTEISESVVRDRVAGEPSPKLPAPCPIATESAEQRTPGGTVSASREPAGAVAGPRVLRRTAGPKAPSSAYGLSLRLKATGRTIGIEASNFSF